MSPRVGVKGFYRRNQSPTKNKDSASLAVVVVATAGITKINNHNNTFANEPIRAGKD